jgi:hypothetical protein
MPGRILSGSPLPRLQLISDRSQRAATYVSVYDPRSLGTHDTASIICNNDHGRQATGILNLSATLKRLGIKNFDPGSAEEIDRISSSYGLTPIAASHLRSIGTGDEHAREQLDFALSDANELAQELERFMELADQRLENPTSYTEAIADSSHIDRSSGNSQAKFESFDDLQPKHFAQSLRDSARIPDDTKRTPTDINAGRIWLGIATGIDSDNEEQILDARRDFLFLSNATHPQDIAYRRIILDHINLARTYNPDAYS